MLNWLKSLFVRLDRGDAAAERIAVALEQMAEDVEAARDTLRWRLGIEMKEPPAIEAKNGHKRKTATV